MLPALYIALAAAGVENLSEAGDRAAAWAAGLPADSPLIPVADVLLAAPRLGVGPDAVLRHLFGIPAFTRPARPQDRGWHSWPGTELPALAFELGFRQVYTLDGKIIRPCRNRIYADNLAATGQPARGQVRRRRCGCLRGVSGSHARKGLPPHCTAEPSP